MRSAIFAAVFAAMILPSTLARADWMKAAEDAELALYVDEKATRRDGDIVTAKIMMSLNKPVKTEIGKYKSIISDFRFNCKDESSEHVYGILLTDAMGTGKVVTATAISGGWKTINMETNQGIIYRAVCAAK